MNIASFSIKHKVSVILAVIMLSTFGVIFASQLQMALMPNMELPMAVVISYYNGANPEDIEELVTKPLESAIMSVSGVDEITSTSADSVSQIQITYVDGTDLDIAATKLREKFDMVSLPDDATDPMIMNLNISELMPTAMIALGGDDLAHLQTLAEDVVGPALERIDGVASITISGGLTQQIAVRVDSAAAAGYGLSNSYIAQILAAENLLYPGGDMKNGEKILTVSTDAKFQSIDDVANLILPLPTGGTVRLNEVATIALENEDIDSLAKVGSNSCVLIQVSKRSGSNEVATSNAIVERLEELKKDNPTLSYSIPYLASDFINQSVDSSFESIFLGVFLAAFVVFVFLRRFSATMTIVISMPVCILVVFVLMYAMGLTLNMMSLGGIALGVGMIVDNSIVVLENIYRFAADGKNRMEACVEGTKEVTSSVVASTLTTEAVFVPLGLTGGMAGMMFRDFCLTIASLLAASLLISLTLVPLLCYMTLDEEKVRRQQMKKSNQKPNAVSQFFQGMIEKLNHVYLGLLNFFVRHLTMGLLVCAGLLVFFIASLTSLDMVMTPQMDQGQINISVTMPTGSQVDESSAIADRIVQIVEQECPELSDMYYMAEHESVMFMVNLVDKSERSRSSFAVAESLKPILDDIAGCEITCSSSSSMSTSSSDDLTINVTGTELDTLSMIADDLMEQLKETGNIYELDTSLSKQVPQVKVTMNRETASQYGLTAASVGAAVRAELTGSTATTVTLDGTEIDVVVKGDGASSESLDALRSMPVTSATGGTIPLSAIAQVNIELAPQSITRINQSREITITGSFGAGNSTQINQQVQTILDNYIFPEGYTAEISGQFSDMMDSFADLLLALVVALALVYFVLAAQFESFLLPIMVMMILPLAFTGALFALPVTNRDLSMISFIAIIVLAGTVVNSSIILIEYIKIRREMGENRLEAILHACPRRVRPVMMTALTTILALVPMSLALGNNNEMMSEMGCVMIFGMAISTLITLVFTPVFYCVLDNLGHLTRKSKRSRSSQSTPTV